MHSVKAFFAENFEDILVVAGLLLLGASIASWFLFEAGPLGLTWISIVVGLILSSGVQGHTFVERRVFMFITGVLCFLLWSSANNLHAKRLMKKALPGKLPETIP
jgi:hypothetical protein